MEEGASGSTARAAKTAAIAATRLMLCLEREAHKPWAGLGEPRGGGGPHGRIGDLVQASNRRGRASKGFFPRRGFGGMVVGAAPSAVALGVRPPRPPLLGGRAFLGFAVKGAVLVAGLFVPALWDAVQPTLPFLLFDLAILLV